MQGTEGTGQPLAIDLTECDREPIHIPGAIQPHGILFALSGADLRIVAVSENAVPHGGAGPHALLGRPLADVIDDSSLAQARAALSEPGQSLRIARLTFRGSQSGPWRGTLHAPPNAHENCLLLEAEPLPPGAEIDALDHFSHFQNAMLRLQAAPDFPTACQRLTTEVQNLTGYSRVMLYRFTPEWNGEVIAEATDGQMPSYAGLHFPAADIPVQARALFARNGARHIPDVAYRRVRLLQETPAPIDLGDIALRSVSPVHIVYLRNMGVGASLSVSVMRNGRLWGLLACHHPAAKLLPQEKIQSCVLLSQIAGARLSLIEEADLARTHVTAKAVEARLLREAAQAEIGTLARPLSDLLAQSGQALLDLVGATGVVMNCAGQQTTLGQTPTGAALQNLLGWLTAMGHTRLITDNLAAWPAAPGIAPAAGLLALPLGGAKEDFIIWLRPEIVRTVTWAGEPIKPAAGEQLTPRSSFAAWTQQVRGRCHPWTPADIAAADSLCDTLMEILRRRAAHIMRMNTQLMRSNEELESFAHIASHDLKEPLRQIEMFGTLLRRAFGRQSDPPEKIERWFNGISTSAHRLRVLIDHLAQYARLGGEINTLEPTDTAALVAEVLQDFSGKINEIGCIIEIGPLPVVTCHAIQIRQVLQNLVSNAIKYRHPDRQLVLRISAAPQNEGGHAESEPPDARTPMIALRIEDNGIGFDERYADQIFRPFERLHSVEKYEGSGLGLAICRKVIERHGGTISASSRPDAGAVFTFTLPHRPASEKARAA